MGAVPELSALLGRDAELDRLVAHLDLSADGSKGSVLLGGPAGIGKTGLVSALVAAAAKAGVPAVIGHCVGQAGVATSYLPFIELVGSAAELRPAAAERTATRHPSLGRLFGPDLGQLPGSADPAAVAEAVNALLLACAAESPVLVVVEDVHWADHSSRDLLSLLLTRGFGAPVKLVVTYRSDDLHRRHPLTEALAAWTRLPAVAHVELGPLPDRVIRTIAQRSGAAKEHLAAVARRAEGNPFFAEELAVSGGNVGLGDTLTRILRSRIDGLSDGARSVVRTAALHGRRISHDLLRRVVPTPDDELDSAVREAVDRGILSVDSEGAYTFRHALLAEAAADDLLPGERRRLHGAYLAALTDDTAAGSAADRVLHAVGAGDDSAVVTSAIAAGDEARSVGGPHEALGHYELALTWMDEADPRRDETVLQAARAADAAGDTARAVGMLHDRLTHPPAGETPQTRARLLAALAREARLVDVLPEPPWEFAFEAYQLASPEPSVERLEILLAYADALSDLMRDEEAMAVADEAIELANQLDRPDLATEMRGAIFRSMNRSRDPQHAARVLAEARAASGNAEPGVAMRLFLNSGYAERDAGRPDRALQLFDAGAAIADRARMPWSPWGSHCRINGAVTALDLGDLDGALARTRIPGARGPEPRATHLEIIGLLSREIRSADVTPDEVNATRSVWHLDGFPAHQATVLGLLIEWRLGRPEEAAALVASVLPVLQRSWGDAGHAIIRYTAMLAAIVADAAARGTAVDPTWTADLARYADEARQVVATEPSGPEAHAWLARMEAELLRLDPAAGPGDVVAAWRRAVEAFTTNGSPLETAAAETGLAVALAADGENAAAARLRRDVRQSAERFGAAALLLALDRAEATTPDIADALPAGVQAPTAREREVLELLALGRTNGQIAAKLFISTKTASVHVSNLLAKLGARNRGEAVAIARDLGLLD